VHLANCWYHSPLDALTICTVFIISLVQERPFELGERLDVLSQVSQPAIIPHMAEFEGKRFPYEVRGACHCLLQRGRHMCGRQQLLVALRCLHDKGESVEQQHHIPPDFKAQQLCLL
jgi:hypothetical protein